MSFVDNIVGKCCLMVLKMILIMLRCQRIGLVGLTGEMAGHLADTSSRLTNPTLYYNDYSIFSIRIIFIIEKKMSKKIFFLKGSSAKGGKPPRKARGGIYYYLRMV